MCSLLSSLSTFFAIFHLFKLHHHSNHWSQTYFTLLLQLLDFQLKQIYQSSNVRRGMICQPTAHFSFNSAFTLDINSCVLCTLMVHFWRAYVDLPNKDELFENAPQWNPRICKWDVATGLALEFVRINSDFGQNSLKSWKYLCHTAYGKGTFRSYDK